MAKKPSRGAARPDKAKRVEPRVGVSNVVVSLSPNKKTLSISYGGRADLTVEMETAQVDDMLSAIAKWRSEMLPSHPEIYAPVARVTAIRDPRWYTEAELSVGGSLLHLRHYGFGWLSFWLPKNEAAKLANFLQAQAEEQEKPPPSRKN
jgi:hypothetical protein